MNEQMIDNLTLALEKILSMSKEDLLEEVKSLGEPYFFTALASCDRRLGFQPVNSDKDQEFSLCGFDSPEDDYFQCAA